MENCIIIIILLLAAGIGIFQTVRHFRNRGGCCGGGGYRPKGKKLKNILYTKTFRVEGMHCDHCKNRVEEAVNDIKGIAGKVNLKKGELSASYAEEVEDTRILERLARAGYPAFPEPESENK